MADKSLFVTNDIFGINAITVLEDVEAVPGQDYSFITFPGCGYERVIFTEGSILFTSSDTDTVEIVDEDGNAIYSYDKSVDGNFGDEIKLEFKWPAKSPDELQSIGFRWVKDGGKVNATLRGRIFMIPAENYFTYKRRY